MLGNDRSHRVFVASHNSSLVCALQRPKIPPLCPRIAVLLTRPAMASEGTTGTCPMTPCSWCTLGVGHDACFQDIQRAWQGHCTEHHQSSMNLWSKHSEKMMAYQFLMQQHGTSDNTTSSAAAVEPRNKRFKGGDKGTRPDDATPASSSGSGALRGLDPVVDLVTNSGNVPESYDDYDSYFVPADGRLPHWQYAWLDFDERTIRWTDYDCQTSLELEAAYNNHHRECTVFIDGWFYTVHFTTKPMTQMSSHSEIRRQVRRIVAGSIVIDEDSGSSP